MIVIMKLQSMIKKIFFGFLITLVLGFLLALVTVPYFSDSYISDKNRDQVKDYTEIFEEEKSNDKVDQTEEEKFIPIRLDIPESLRAVYMTSCVAGTPSLRNRMVQLIEETELNAIIIDIKDFTGMISFRAEDPDLAEAYATHCPVWDMRDFVYSLNEKGIFVIGRVTVFQDKFLAKKRPDLAVQKESDGGIWKDNKGIHFTDPGAKEVWDYHVRLTRESYDLGFDEINFDYIRFPSDGPMSDTYFPVSEGRNKSEVMEEFFAYLHNELRDLGVVTSADLFGMTTSSTNDLGIGQIWEKALPYFDYLSPMVYPSHYPHGFKGLGNPNHSPYEIVNWSLVDAVRRTVATSTPIKTLNGQLISGTSTPAVYSKESYDPSVVRPWLQDFNYGGTYGPAEVRAQIKATYDAGLDSWMLWDPSNRYTREALDPAS